MKTRTSPTRNTTPPQGFSPTILAAAVVAIAAVVVYSNSFNGVFVFDDLIAIQHNATIRQLWPVRLFMPPYLRFSTVDGRPLLNYSFALNYALGGLQVSGYHAVNLLLHLCAALTLLGVLRRTFLSPALRGRYGERALPLSLAIVLLWAVHPLQTETVTYICQRAELIVSLFYLLTLYGLIRASDTSRPRIWYAGSVAACLLGMASKEVMITAPVVALMYDRTFLAGSFHGALAKRARLYLALCSTWSVLAMNMVSNTTLSYTVGHNFGNEWWRYLLLESTAITRYIALSFWPHPLILDYGLLPWQGVVPLLPTLLLVALLLALTGLAFSRWPAAGFAGVWFFMILAPTSSVIPLREFIFEHRMYLPLAAVLTLSVLGFRAGWERFVDERPSAIGQAPRRVVPAVLFAAVLSTLGVLTLQRNSEYRSLVAIWGANVARRPDNPRSRLAYGGALLHAGRPLEAVEQLERALALEPEQPVADDGNILAWLDTAPNAPDAANDLGAALLQLGRTDEAVARFEQAIRIWPRSTEALTNLGKLALNRADYAAAAEYFRRRLEIMPDSKEANNDYAKALAYLGRYPEAVEVFERNLRRDANDKVSLFNLSQTLSAAGQLPEALARFEQLLRLDPANADVRQRVERLRAAVDSATAPPPR